MYSTVKSPSFYNVGIYIRLSQEDEDKAHKRESESESVLNQRSLIMNYLRDNGFILTDEYVDDGYSGTNFDRPSFKRLLEDIENGKINCVITKDLSRLGRDYIKCGYYIEQYFPLKKVRYISILDNVDTFLDSANNDIAPFKALFNDMTSKDTSKKIKSILRDKKVKGKFIGSKPSFGYMRDPLDKGHLVPNPDTAWIVKRIFNEVSRGDKISDIIERLNNENIPTPSAYKQIKKLLVNNKYEFIHCHSPIGGVCGRLAAKVTHTKVIYTAHGFHFYKGASKLNWMIYYPIEKVLSYITDVLITINKEDYELAKRVEYVPGIGVDTNKFAKVVMDKNEKRKELGLCQDNIVLLSVGELNKNKNHEVIIRALAKLENSNIQYIIAGRGNLELSLKELAKELNIEKQVHFLGFRTDISELYNISDIFCFPSYREGLSVALMEAMSSGISVVCSNIRGNRDLIHNDKGGYLCNPKNVDEFLTKIRHLYKNKNIMIDMGRHNQVYINKFDIEIVNEQMSKIYKVINNK